ncbi:hypothetical protein [Micromonospora sp. NPDC023633]|uniref:hypothetical protein n=1 Tax=Micromonospora sp. NPDC023633 TaxID=3154320 RepID=UPI0033E29C2A
MPGPIQAGWESGLIVAGVAGLLGVVWPGRLSTGLGIELASVLMLGTITGMDGRHAGPRFPASARWVTTDRPVADGPRPGANGR